MSVLLGSLHECVTSPPVGGQRKWHEMCSLSTAIMNNVDWNFLAQDLAAHLIAAPGAETTDRILRDAERDASRLVAPRDFWSRVADEYERQLSRLGVEGHGYVRVALRRMGSVDPETGGP